MTIFYSTLIFMSLMIMFSPHPVSMVVVILLQTTVVCLLIWILTKSSWFSFILFLIFLGGLMVLFIYITSLASNEMFNLKNSLNSSTLILFCLLMITLLVSTFFSKNYTGVINALSEKILILLTKNFIFPTIMIMTYLLLVLLVVVKISSMMEGPVRNFI